MTTRKGDSPARLDPAGEPRPARVSLHTQRMPPRETPSPDLPERGERAARSSFEEARKPLPAPRATCMGAEDSDLRPSEPRRGRSDHRREKYATDGMEPALLSPACRCRREFRAHCLPRPCSCCSPRPCSLPRPRRFPPWASDHPPRRPLLRPGSVQRHDRRGAPRPGVLPRLAGGGPFAGTSFAGSAPRAIGGVKIFPRNVADLATPGA